MAGLIIGTVEGYMIVLSLGIILVYPLESPNPGSELSDMLSGAPLGLWFGSEAIKCLCC